jgi:ABC-type branched-subunit amino acid transport system ATPase component
MARSVYHPQNVRRAQALAHRARVLENGRLVPAGPVRERAAGDRLKKVYLGL